MDVLGVMDVEGCRKRAQVLLSDLAHEGILPGAALEVLRHAIAHLHNLVPDHQGKDMKRATVEALLITAQEVHDGAATVWPPMVKP